MSIYSYTPCLEPACDQYVFKAGRCKKHYVPWVGSTRRERLPKNWAVLREAILVRDNGVCYVCGESGADAVDHIEAGDNHSASNLAAIHQDVPPFCHRSKTAQEGHAAQGHKVKKPWPGAPF